MNTKKYNVKVISGALAGVLVLSLGVISYAANNQRGNGNFGGQNRPQMQMKQNVDFKAKLAELVTAGSITQAQADKIISLMDNQQATMKAEHEKIKAMTDAERKAYFEANKPVRTNILSSLVSDGTLTQTQADLVAKSIMPAGRGGNGGSGMPNGRWDRGNFGGQNKTDSTQAKLTPEQMQAKMDEQMANRKAEMTATLAQTVSNGTITQATSDKLVAYLDNKDAERKTQMDNHKSSNSKNRGAKVKQSNNVAQKGDMMQGPLSDAVTDGIITADQAKAINDIMRAKQDATRKQAMVTELAKIVTAGTLTQEQADQVIASIDKEQATKAAEREKISAMTKAERKTYFEQNKPERVKPLADLVSDGTLTQEQADIIIKQIMKNGDMGRRGGERGMMGFGAINNSATMQ